MACYFWELLFFSKTVGTITGCYKLHIINMKRVIRELYILRRFCTCYLQRGFHPSRSGRRFLDADGRVSGGVHGGQPRKGSRNG